MRKPYRVLLEGVYYHVMCRGNQKQKIFLCDDDYEHFLVLLKRYKKRLSFRLFAWCLMPNHVHLVVEVPMPRDLSRLMHGMNLAYARWFNGKYGKVGHLWQGRFKSSVILKEEYALRCIEYIELNPVRAKLVADPLAYPWTSFKARVFGENSCLLDNVEL